MTTTTERRVRHFEIRAPRKDFTGKLGSIAFADGIAKVSFDDARDSTGLAVAEEHAVSPGRSAVLFAQRRQGYTVIEVDAAGEPLVSGDPPASEDERKPAANTKGTSK